LFIKRLSLPLSILLLAFSGCSFESTLVITGYDGTPLMSPVTLETNHRGSEWASSDESVITVDQTGLVSIVDPSLSGGVAYITAMNGGNGAEIRMNVGNCGIAGSWRELVWEGYGCHATSNYLVLNQNFTGTYIGMAFNWTTSGTSLVLTPEEPLFEQQLPLDQTFDISTGAQMYLPVNAQSYKVYNGKILSLGDRLYINN